MRPAVSIGITVASVVVVAVFTDLATAALFATGAALGAILRKEEQR